MHTLQTGTKVNACRRGRSLGNPVFPVIHPNLLLWHLLGPHPVTHLGAMDLPLNILCDVSFFFLFV